MLNLTKFFAIISISFLSSIDSYSESSMTLDDQKMLVNFSDGDTFKILDGALKGSRVRVIGFNALESYGPVHEWKENSLNYLYAISQEATKKAKSGSWNCSLEPGRDTYGRLMAECNDLAEALISAGLAHAYSVDASPAKYNYVAQQKIAQEKNLGMWKFGIPHQIITSLHSADEGAKNTYDRAISTTDGSSQLIKHQENRRVCQKVCIEEGSSCMVFVPFNIRYGTNRPDCLRVNS